MYINLVRICTILCHWVWNSVWTQLVGAAHAEPGLTLMLPANDFFALDANDIEGSLNYVLGCFAPSLCSWTPCCESIPEECPACLPACPHQHPPLPPQTEGRVMYIWWAGAVDPLEGSGTKGLAQVSSFDLDADLEFHSGQPDEGPSYRRDGLPIKQPGK